MTPNVGHVRYQYRHLGSGWRSSEQDPCQELRLSRQWHHPLPSGLQIRGRGQEQGVPNGEDENGMDNRQQLWCNRNLVYYGAVQRH